MVCLYPLPSLIFSGMVQRLGRQAETHYRGGALPTAAVQAAIRQRRWLALGLAAGANLLALALLKITRRFEFK